jgi:hypothetical protein
MNTSITKTADRAQDFATARETVALSCRWVLENASTLRLTWTATPAAPRYSAAA